ncbi:MAG TPA: hypothetical protein VFJ82_11510 [Longimicrobium sp.]|nr:hypothetical protein [Longimicrobium sp.]
MKPRVAAFAALAGVALAACAAPVPVSPAPAAAPAATAGAPPAAKLTPRAALERYYPQVLAAGMAENDVIVFVVTPSGRVVKHALLHTIPGTAGTQIENLLQPYLDLVINFNAIHTKPGELAPTPVYIAWADLAAEVADSTTP